MTCEAVELHRARNIPVTTYLADLNNDFPYVPCATPAAPIRNARARKWLQFVVLILCALVAIPSLKFLVENGTTLSAIGDFAGELLARLWRKAE
jgi:hypothetical protein